MQRTSGIGLPGKRGTIASLCALGLLFLVSAVLAFPRPWNSAMAAMKDAVGFHFPYVTDNGFTLGLDLKGGAHLVYEADMSSIPDGDRAEALEGVRDVVERRVNAFGVSEPVVQTNISGDAYRVFVDLPGVADASDAVAQIGETPVLAFRVPIEDFNAEPTEEQEAQVEAAQQREREAALAVLDRAQSGEDFGQLAGEVSINEQTKASGGYIGFVAADDEEFGGLISRIVNDRLKVGVIDGLYESTSRMYIVDYLSRKKVVEPEVSHILISWAGATRSEQTRTKEEALELIEEIRKDAGPRNFAELAKEYSEDPSVASNGGNLGFIKAGEMVAPFEEAALALRDGRISKVVETEYGYHILYREDSQSHYEYELAVIEMPWTTISDIFVIDPWMDTELSGKHVRRASVAFDPNTRAPYIVLDFNSEGADLFATITEENIGSPIGIFLDGQPIATPVVQEAIYGGQASITGDFTLNEAKVLVQRLNAGALPVPIHVVSQQTIGPTLGSESLEASVWAGMVGFALVALFLVLYYRLPGLVSVVGLTFYALINLALYKIFGVTLTLAGIAGLVFSLGIAVDANVLIFERMKEELRSGRDLPTALEEGFRRAWPSIRDGNMTTLIGTAVLYTLTTGSIRGFAFTLTLGILVSLFTAMVATRFVLRALVRCRSLHKPLLFLGMPKQQK